PFLGKTVRDSGLREIYQCMLVGFEDGVDHLVLPQAQRVFEQGDVVWIVGERTSLLRLIGQHQI
ncbi:MAG: TrkA C-terminal domain-containing protein, partial [Bacteroidaceae bacterium]|nr:TrkA C-terminal domain-containing protein [Bacteroidaceae bacterium]